MAFQGKVANVKACKFGTFAGEDAVEHELDKFERCCGCADVARVADEIASNCDAGAVGSAF